MSEINNNLYFYCENPDVWPETWHVCWTPALTWRRLAAFSTTLRLWAAAAFVGFVLWTQTMSSLQLLRVLVNERLSAAAEEIFEAVKETIAGYEEQILLSKREVRMLQRVVKPEIKISKHSGLWVASMLWIPDLYSDLCPVKTQWMAEIKWGHKYLTCTQQKSTTSDLSTRLTWINPWWESW